jgi:DNA-binding NarL/FixJ family response regulator
MSAKISVAVFDDHPLFRAGVVHTLASAPEIEIVGQGTSAVEAARIVEADRPDVIVLDVNMPGCGLAALDAIIVAHPETKVIMLTVSADQEHVLRAMRSGAHGYVIKGVSGTELIQAIRSVYEGDRYLSPALGAKLLAHSRSAPSESAQPTSSSDLSNREKQILALVGAGLSNKEIALKLQLSEKTVKHYMTRLLQKLHVRSRIEAAILVAKGKSDFSIGVIGIGSIGAARPSHAS